MARRLWRASIPKFDEPLGTLFRNLVVGAGPAGFAVTSTLLGGGSSPTLWIDPKFQAGRLQQYLEVPSNTKVKLFSKFADTSPESDSSWATEQFRVGRSYLARALALYAC